MKYSVRIRDRAIRRCGELLKQIEPAKPGPKAEIGMGTHTQFGREAAGEQAGLSKHQQVQAIRVANVPAEEFNRQVESANPPTVTALAEQGKKAAPRPVIDLNGRDPGEFNRSLHFVAEFGMGQATAYRFMQVAEAYGAKLTTVINLDVTALYALAAPKTPLEVREEIERMAIDRVAKGEGDTLEGWLAYGAALNEGRKLFPGDREFGQWVVENVLYQVGNAHRPEDQIAAMWASANPEQFHEARAAGNARTVRGIHAKWNEIDAERQAAIARAAAEEARIVAEAKAKAEAEARRKEQEAKDEEAPQAAE